MRKVVALNWRRNAATLNRRAQVGGKAFKVLAAVTALSACVGIAVHASLSSKMATTTGEPGTAVAMGVLAGFAFFLVAARLADSHTERTEPRRAALREHPAHLSPWGARRVEVRLQQHLERAVHEKREWLVKKLLIEGTPIGALDEETRAAMIALVPSYASMRPQHELGVQGENG